MKNQASIDRMEKSIPSPVELDRDAVYELKTGLTSIHGAMTFIEKSRRMNRPLDDATVENMGNIIKRGIQKVKFIIDTLPVRGSGDANFLNCGTGFDDAL